MVLALGTIKVRHLRAGLGMALLNFDKAKLAQAENRPVNGLHATACLLSKLKRTPWDSVSPRNEADLPSLSSISPMSRLAEACDDTDLIACKQFPNSMSGSG